MRAKGRLVFGYFIKDLDVNLTMESCVEYGIKHIPQVINIETLLIIVLNSFNGR